MRQWRVSWMALLNNYLVENLNSAPSKARVHQIYKEMASSNTYFVSWRLSNKKIRDYSDFHFLKIFEVVILSL